jgi:hypothetical protein
MGRGPQAVRGGHYSECPVFKAAAGQRKRRKNVRKNGERGRQNDRNKSSTTKPLHGAGVLPKKQTAAQVVKNVSAFYGTRKFITLFTTVRHWAIYSPDLHNLSA